MNVCKTIAELRAALLPLKHNGKSIGVVPTMGYLHIGHMQLVKTAKAKSDIIVVTIFVNPTQFAAGEDLSTYPRDLERDLAMLKAEGADFVFAPDVKEIYPDGEETIVETVKLSKVLMGKIRPGHFRGVATVCAKLFNITLADKAFFGEKDFQQVAVIKRMVKDLNMPLEIIPVPTVREKDGLACSSRNVRLTKEDRVAALVLSQSLDAVGALIAAGERSIPVLLKTVNAILKSEPRGVVEGVFARDAVTLQSVSGVGSVPFVLLLTVKFGAVRLIDNRIYTP
jgi:pantoate--beta-alanine ligase